MKINKLAIIGCGGIGSYFIRGLSEVIKKDISGFEELNIMGIDIFDYDLVEERNLSYQYFDIEHLGHNKAEVLAEMTGYSARAEKIERAEQLAEYDLVIMAVDNNEVRNLVYQAGRPFLDLRANGKTILAYLTQKDDAEYLTLTKDNGQKGGCQRSEDIEERHIQCGNRVVAEAGIQILADYLRGETTKKNLILTI